MYLPHSLIRRESPSRTATRLPNELKAIKKLRPLLAELDPKTCLKSRLAEISFAAFSSALGTAAKYATFARM